MKSNMALFMVLVFLSLGFSIGGLVRFWRQDKSASIGAICLIPISILIACLTSVIFEYLYKLLTKKVPGRISRILACFISVVMCIIFFAIAYTF